MVFKPPHRDLVPIFRKNYYYNYYRVHKINKFIKIRGEFKRKNVVAT